MDEIIDEYFIGSIVAVIAGVYSFFNSFNILKKKHTIANIPTSKIRSLAMGKVEIYGKIKPHLEKTTTPFTNKECVFCEWTVEEYVSDKKSGRWVIRFQGRDGKHINIEDDTGKVLVDTTGAEVDLPIDFETKKVKEIPDSILQTFKISSKWWSSIFNRYRFREYVLYEDNTGYIMGFADDNPFMKEGTASKNEADIMIQQKEGEFFYISDSSEQEVVSQMNSKFIGSLLLGVVLIIGGLLIFFTKINIL